MGNVVQFPARKLSAGKKLKNLAIAYDELAKHYNHQRRLLWMAVHAAGGRLEIHPDVYKSTMAAPTLDTMVKVETDSQKNRVVLVFCDEKGERLPESEPSRIIVP